MSHTPEPNHPEGLSKQDVIRLLNSVSLGSTVAEQDSKLMESRIETPTFVDLFRDRVDLIPGTKGSGKTALFRLISEHSRALLLKTRIVMLTGVEASGDPVFLAFKKHFESLDETTFENFWRVYFTALILERFIKNDEFQDLLESAPDEVAEFRAKCKEARIPELTQEKSLREIVRSVFSFIKIKLGQFEPSDSGGSYSLLTVEPIAIEPSEDLQDFEPDGPVFLSDIHKSLLSILAKANVRLWVLLDRLDEVFPRRTKLERLALRALLRTTRNFPTEQVRIKLFIRDDILNNVLLDGEGFTALSHIEARSATTLQWRAEQIQLLIVKRFSSNPRIRSTFQINKALVEQNDVNYCSELFYRIFPHQVVPGKNQSDTLDWLFKHCSDGCGVVTPRDVISLLELALKRQIDHLQNGQPPSVSPLISAIAIKEAFAEMSIKKCRTYFQAEFPDFWETIKKFERSKAEHDNSSLARLLGSKWEDDAEHLVSLGFLKKSPRGNTYTIPFLFRPAMGVRQGKAFGKKKDSASSKAE